MKRIALILTVFLLLAACKSESTKLSLEHIESLPKHTFTFKNKFEVTGRQGIATDGEYYYVSGSKEIYKYDKEGNLIESNTNPFEEYEIPSNHIGDIDVYNGEIFISAENFMDGVGKDIQIAIHDAKTLKFKKSFKFNPDSGQEEVSGICVDRDKKTVWMSSWVGENSGRYLYEYDLETGKYLRKIHLYPVPQWIQGIYYFNGSLYVTADDGEADFNEPDHLYRVEIDANGTSAKIVEEKAFTEVEKQGEIEGLTVDPKTNELLVLFNRGARIILGMPKGFYDGYDKEIHEVYRFDIKSNEY